MQGDKYSLQVELSEGESQPEAVTTLPPVEGDPLSAEEVEAVARWHSVNHSLYALWLDSGEYEGWARARLLDLPGQVNQSGMNVARMLSAHIPTCIWLFRDSTEEGDADEVVDCPICGKALEKNVKYGSGKCLDCHVLL